MDEQNTNETLLPPQGPLDSGHRDKESEEGEPKRRENREKKRMSGWAFVSAFLVGINALLILFINPYIALLIACAGIWFAIKAIKKINASDNRLSGKRVAVGAIIFQAVVFAGQAYWRIDAPPIPNDYTIADLKSAPSEFDETYHLLLSLADPNEKNPGAPGIGLTAEDVNLLKEVKRCFKGEDFESIYAAIDANSENILRLWAKANKGRDIIERLLSYDQIADLSEPVFDFDTEHYANLRNIIYIYNAHICLQCRKHNFDEATNELLKLNELNQKLNTNARSMIAKLVYMGFAALNIQTANFIANHPATPAHCIEAMGITFQGLSEEQTSMRNQMVFEYLLTKGALELVCEEAIKELDMPLTSNERVRNLFKETFNRSMLKYNSTLRLSRNLHDRWLAYEEGRERTEDDEFDVWPAVYPDLPVEIDANGKMPRYYFVYNPIGSLLLGILLPAYEKVFQVRSKLIVHDDLLQIVLNKRLGNPYSLEAHDFSEQYIIDCEKEKIFSPGPDGENYTDDDIYLLINPRELGFEE